MRNYLIYFAALCLFLASCKKEDKPTQSPDMQDPFARIDNPANPADHQIYLFYKASGIPVLYSDTVAKNPLTKLNLGYHLTSIDSMVTAKYLHSQADILSGLNFVKNQLAPYLTNSLKPYSILLTDSVYTSQPDPSGSGALVEVPLSAYLGFNTLAISYVSAIATMNPTQMKAYRKDILKTILTAKISADPTLTTKFYAVSSAYYNKTAYGLPGSPYYIPYAPKGVYGLLVNGTEGPDYYDIGGPTQDLSDYLDTVLVMSPADFISTYQSYPLVIQKYNYLLDIFKTINFTVPQ